MERDQEQDRRSGGQRRALNPRALLDCLRSCGVEFVVIGGFAVAAHGVVRATKDVDIVPEPSAENRARLAEALRELRAEVDLGDISVDELAIVPDEAGLATGGNRVLQTAHGRLDVMQDVPGLRSFEQLRAGAVRHGGILYAGYEELVSMKSSAGRPEDLMDIARLRAARGEP
jgi:hypothetical protein